MRCLAFVRKEVVEIARQPRLIGLLVVGPFALLLLLGMGYGEQSFVKRAVFVASEDSVYASFLEGDGQQLDQMLESSGVVPTEEEGRALLEADDVDVVVVFPDDALASVVEGEQAVIRVLHNEIDPFQAQAVQVAARLAVQEVNSTVLERVVSEAESELRTGAEYSSRLDELSRQLADDPDVGRTATEEELTALEAAVDGTDLVVSRLAAEESETATDLDTTRSLIADARGSLAALEDGATAEEQAQASSDVEALGLQLADTALLEPEVLVRPFTSDTESVGLDTPTPTEYFTPSSLVLLLQHMALTFAALSLVRDRRTGLFELMRVGPLSAAEIVVGKILAFLLIGGAVGAALVATSVFLLGISFAGSVAWLAVLMTGLLLSSVALGMIFAALSSTESQAVQLAMLALLASLFFTGFVLPLETMNYPAKLVSWVLPVTYGIEGLHDVMLLGRVPSTRTLVGLATVVVVYGVLAMVAVGRRLRSEVGS